MDDQQHRRQRPGGRDHHLYGDDDERRGDPIHGADHGHQGRAGNARVAVVPGGRRATCLQAAVAEADADNVPVNILQLSAGTYYLTTDNLFASTASLTLANLSSLPSKSITLVGQGAANTVIEPGPQPWFDRILTIDGQAGLTAVLQDLTITGGNLQVASTGTAAQGGGVLIDGGQVTMSNAAVTGNQASTGRPAAPGPQEPPGQAGADGQTGRHRPGRRHLPRGRRAASS